MYHKGNFKFSWTLIMKILTLIILTFFNYAHANNTDKIWRINNDHSELFFKVPYLTISKVTGRFSKFSGRVHIDGDFNIATKISLRINSSSIYTGNEMRDGHLKSKEFLKAQKFPNILFESESIVPAGPGSFNVKGFLTVKGIKKSFSVLFKLSDGVKDTWGYESKFASFRAKISRSEFGIKWNKFIGNNKFLVGDTVEVWGKFQIQPLNYLTPGFKHKIPFTKYIKWKNKLNRGEISQAQFDAMVSGAKGSKTDVHENKNESESVNVKNKKNEEKYIIKEAPSNQRFRENTAWWVSYLGMGLIGFFATIIVCFQGKYFFIRLWPKKYEEVGLLGFLSDLIVLPISFLYAWAMWYIGYGIP